MQEIEVPIGSTLLSVQNQDEKRCLWILVPDTNAKKETILLRTVGTGNSIYDDVDPKDFLGTYQLFGGQFVGHVFRVIR